MSGFGPPPGAPLEDVRRRPPAYLPPGGLSRSPAPSQPDGPGMPVVPVARSGSAPGDGLAAPGSDVESAAVPRAYRGGGVVRGTERVLLVTSHKPGIISLRPMSLGDLVDGAVKHIRRNPGPVLSLSVLVLAASAVPAILLAAVTAGGSWYGDVGADVVLDATGFFGLVLLAGVGFASLLLGGVLSYSVGEAILGRRPTVAELWAAARPRLLTLVRLDALVTLALALPVVLLVLLVALAVRADSVLAAVAVAGLGGLGLMAWTAVVVTRTCLAGCAVVLERRGVRDALRRSWALSRRVFWRTVVRLAVVGGLGVIVFWVVQLPMLLLSALLGVVLDLSPTWAALVSSLGTAVATLLSAAVVVPFVAGATALLYVDQRMRTEGFDMVLQRAARTGTGGPA